MKHCNSNINGSHELAKKHGYKITIDSRNANVFSKNDLHVWPTWYGWQTAYLIDGHLAKHQLFDENDLEGALKR